MPSKDRQRPAWLRAPLEAQGLKQYLDTIRERIWLVLLAVVATTAVAVAYVATAEKVYEAEADVLVAPVSADSDVQVNAGLLRDSSDRLRVIETASRLVTTPDSAALASELTGLSPDDPEDLLEDVTAEPIAESDLVGITASASTAEQAADLANAFAEATITTRSQEVRARAMMELERLGDGSSDDATQATISALERLTTGPVPDMTLQTRATPPASPVSPRPLLSLLAGIVGGLMLGVGAAFLLRQLDPRFRREEQLRARFNLPILARIPKQATTQDEPLSTEQLSGEAIEALRILRASLTFSDRSGLAPSALVTSASASDGKTTTAFNLAAVLALSGSEVILIEADLRLPRIGRITGGQHDSGIISTLIEETTLDEALVTTPAFGENLKILVAERSGPWLAELFTLNSATTMIDEARRRADFVIIDSPPLTDVVDALPLARAVNDVVVVMRLGSSRLDKTIELGELLAENEIEPAGFVVIGGKPRGGSYYHDYAEESKLSGAKAPDDGSAGGNRPSPDRAAGFGRARRRKPAETGRG